MTNGSIILEVQDFSLSLQTAFGTRLVLDQVGLQVARGEIHGLVGESGCGKSTLVRAMLGLYPLGARVENGRIVLGGQNLLSLSEKQLSRSIRSSRIGFIPQDPFQSLNPLFRLGTQLLEIMRWHAPAQLGDGRRSHRSHLLELMERVRIEAPDLALERYPHEFSGGQLQRLIIAGALACGPELILADEPTSALDVTTQQQLLVLLENLVRETRTSVVLVTHDLGLMAQFCDRVTIMYAGQTVETLPRSAILRDMAHPYARLLLDCHPDREGALKGIPGVVPPLNQMPAGCRFHPRCPAAMPICHTERPDVRQIAESHQASCWALVPDTGRGNFRAPR